MDWVLAWRIGALSVLGVAVGVPAQVRAVTGLRPSSPPGPFAYVLPTALLAAMGLLAAVVGTLLAPAVGLAAPVFRSPWGDASLKLWMNSLLAGLLGGTLAATFLPFYYRVFRPLVGERGFQSIESVRVRLGLPARLAFGGLLEEIVFRWGVLSILAWIGLSLTGKADVTVQWISILGAALAFGAVHLPGASALTGGLCLRAAAVSLAINGWLGIIAGWLAWHRGLAAAITAHAVVHLIWALWDVVRKS